MPTPELLDKLLRAAGPSGHETAPAKVWRDAARAFSDDVRADRVGSSTAQSLARATGSIETDHRLIGRRPCIGTCDQDRLLMNTGLHAVRTKCRPAQRRA